jgi:hypothetical protein
MDGKYPFKSDLSVFVYKIVVCTFVLLSLFAIVLSVLLRFTDSDYPLVSSNSSYSGNTIVWKFSIISENGSLDIKVSLDFTRLRSLKSETLLQIRGKRTNWKM